MANELTLDLSQNVSNALTAIAEQERAKLIPKNDYNQVGNEYSATNRDAVSDGDNLGRGTGVFLDVYNQAAGDKVDITERKNNVKINKYNSSKGYPDFQI
jgi:hypothetical protein